MRLSIVAFAAALVLAMAVPTAMADVSSGLMAQYTFEGNTDDVSGNGYNGLAYGLGYEEGREGGQAGIFYGSSFVDLGTGLAPKHWTVAAWIKLASIGGRQVIFAANDETSGEDGILLVIPKSTDGKARARSMASGTWYHAQDGMALTPGKWTFLAGTSDGTMVTLYRDGVAVSQKAVSENPTTEPPTMPTVIGSRGAMNKDFFKGAIDDLLVYNRALSPEEVTELYAEGIEVEDPGDDDQVNGTTGGSADLPGFYYGWWASNGHKRTFFLVTNRGDKDVVVTMQLWDDIGAPITRPIIYVDGANVSGEFAQTTIPAKGTKQIGLTDCYQATTIFGSGKIAWEIAEGQEGTLDKPLNVLIERHNTTNRMGMFQLFVNGDVWF